MPAPILGAWKNGVMLTSEEMAANVEFVQSLFIAVGIKTTDPDAIAEKIDRIQKNLHMASCLMADAIKNSALAENMSDSSELAKKMGYSSVYLTDEIRKLTSQDLRKESANLKTRAEEEQVLKARRQVVDAKAYYGSIEYAYYHIKNSFELLREQLKLYQTAMYFQGQQ